MFFKEVPETRFYLFLRFIIVLLRVVIDCLKVVAIPRCVYVKDVFVGIATFLSLLQCVLMVLLDWFLLVIVLFVGQMSFVFVLSALGFCLTRGPLTVLCWIQRINSKITMLMPMAPCKFIIHNA